MHSTLYAAQDALEAIIQADATLAPFYGGIGTPPKLDTMLDVIWISGEVDNWTQSHELSNMSQKVETYVIRIHIMRTLPGTFKETRAKVVALSNIMEAAIATDFTLSGAVDTATIDGAAMEEGLADDRRHQVLITQFVTCNASVA